ncbi:hypothetical protein N0V88_006899 [Collariella sp. IMI 366227]|nr:hypothetical protein N0V88_006899 [Collariella sp. IMI 366227]
MVFGVCVVPQTRFREGSRHTTAKTIPVSVGKIGLNFEPNEIFANTGDVIEFRFWPKNHSVVAGDFGYAACAPRIAKDANYFHTGFVPTEEGVNSKVFRYTVINSNPLPIYCSQPTGSHCKNGMVAVINPISGLNSNFTLKDYLARANVVTSVSNTADCKGTGGRIEPLQSVTNSAASGTVTTTALGTVSSTGKVTVTSTETEEVESETETETEMGTETEEQTKTETVTESAAETTTTASSGSASAVTTTAPLTRRLLSVLLLV